MSAAVHEVLGDLQPLTLVDHKADFASVDGMLVTPEYTFYNHPASWWEERLGTPDDVDCGDE